MIWKDFILIKLFIQLRENAVGYYQIRKKNSCVKKPLNTEAVQNRIAKVKIL